jgi:hypothetical protein
MNTALAVAPEQPCQDWLPGFSQPVHPPAAVGPLLRLPVLGAMPPPMRRYAVLLLGRDRFVGDLAREVPLLFYLMLERILRGERSPHREAVLNLGCRLARMPRTVLLETLGLEPRPAVVRFLARCGYGALHDPEARHRLFGACCWWWHEWMMRWQVPHVAVLQSLIYRHWWHAAMALDNLIAHDPAMTMDDGRRILPGNLAGVPLPKAYRRALDEIVSLMDQIRDSPLDARERTLLCARLARCRTLADLAAFRDRLEALIEEALRRHDPRLDDPLETPPPRPGNAWIEPLTTRRMVLDEGEQMHHCLGGHYLGSIERGSYYAYRVLAPERLTVGLERDEDGTWKLDDIAGVGNREPSELMKRRVRRWMEGNMDFDNLRALLPEIHEARADAKKAMDTEIMGDAKYSIYMLRRGLEEMMWTDQALAQVLAEHFAQARSAIVGCRPDTVYAYQRGGKAIEALAAAEAVIEQALKAE